MSFAVAHAIAHPSVIILLHSGLIMLRALLPSKGLKASNGAIVDDAMRNPVI